MDPVVTYSISGCFALLFAVSASEKIRDMRQFEQQVSDYQILPMVISSAAAKGIVLLELAAATLLITPAYLYGIAIGIALLLIYACGIAINLLRGRTDIDCGCQLDSSHGISWYLVARNVFMAGLLALCSLPDGGRPLVWLDYTVVIFFVMAAAMTYVCFNLLAKNYHDQRSWWLT